MFENDVETKRILNIALPFTLSEFILSMCEVVHLAFISRYLGTPAVAALTAVDIFLGTTSEFLGGIIDSQLSITSHALGVGNNYLAGQYVQQAQILFTLFYIPTYVFWWHYVYPATLWLGMSEKVAIMAQSYARVQMINDWMDCMSCSIHSMYEVSDHVWFSSISDVIFEGLGLAAVIPALIYIEGVNLVTLAYIDMGLESLGIIFAIFYPLHKGWLKIFIPGWLCNFSLTNTTGVWNLMRTALPLSFGELVAYGEWELLTIFAAHNGQSQIATWGLLGALWETFESFTEGIGDAAEIRVAYHLGRGNPKSAQISGIKGAIIGTVAAFTVTSLFWIVGEEIPGWFSRGEFH
jgi:Na+-driven multidrug efflux pump